MTPPAAVKPQRPDGLMTYMASMRDAVGAESGTAQTVWGCVGWSSPAFQSETKSALSK